MLKVKLLHPAARIPTYATEGSVGLDLYTIQEGVVMHQIPTRVRTGLAVAIPKGFGGFIQARSGLSVKAGIDRCAGVIDDDYRGEVIVVLKSSTGEYHYSKGEKIAQLVIMPVFKPAVVEVKELEETNRGEGGFGSTDTLSVEWTRKPVVQIKGKVMNGRLYGVVRNHPRCPDGQYVETSPIVQTLSENTFETHNSLYVLERI